MEKSQVTRDQFLAQMDVSDPKRRNRAIQAHREKILAMSEAEFRVHRMLLDLQFKSDAVKASVRRMASEARAKGVK